MFTKDAMVNRFWELAVHRDSILKELEPLQHTLQELVREGREDRKLRADIVAIREPLFDIDQERAFIARAVKNVGGVAPDASN